MDKLQYKKQWIEEQIVDNRAIYLEAQETLEDLKDESNALHAMLGKVKAELAASAPVKTGAMIIDGTTIMTATHTDISEGE